MMSGGNISLGDIEAGSYAAVRKEVEVTEGGGIDRMTGRTTNKDGLDLSSLRVDVVEHDEADEGIDTGNPAIHPSIKKTMSLDTGAETQSKLDMPGAPSITARVQV